MTALIITIMQAHYKDSHSRDDHIYIQRFVMFQNIVTRAVLA